ncbi:hypothetical protein SNOG_09029 [Parastagonospora nodorum SN15]|uniref:Uncharacterized protein n=1 Tax=Phaeosphaeria nodorum (strain SN15 / ATCC MYA-4574 / FGSC 10173) TaxID=321614 RepID=Q0UGT5_PHANO|nr:hypothetical protein SNOG_09029 [Parastagonospora nodorum SN15]EAT83221.1 hypothetical protein SNOG_09029 [Parastagonospora nodorum SN15]
MAGFGKYNGVPSSSLGSASASALSSPSTLSSVVLSSTGISPIAYGSGSYPEDASSTGSYRECVDRVFWPFGRCKLLSHIGVFNLYGDVYVNILKLDWVVDFGNICISRLVHFGGSLEHQGVCKLDSLAYSRGLERGRFNHFRLLDRFVYMYTVKLSRFDHYERYCYVYPIFHACIAAPNYAINSGFEEGLNKAWKYPTTRKLAVTIPNNYGHAASQKALLATGIGLIVTVTRTAATNQQLFLIDDVTIKGMRAPVAPFDYVWVVL